MRPLRAALACLCSGLISGCGYVHFGRAPTPDLSAGGMKLATAYSGLSTEHKILREELALARRETDSLRSALERAGSSTSPASDATAERLTTALEELTNLRAGYARLQADRPVEATSAAALAADQITGLETQVRLAAETNATLEAEVSQLRRDLDRTRLENVALDQQLRSLMQRHDEAREMLALQSAERAVLPQSSTQSSNASDAGNVLARAAANGGNAPVSIAAGVGAPPPPSNVAASPLQLAKAPPAGAVIGDVRGRLDHAWPDAAPTPASRVHRVQAGDTLEQLSRLYYGAPDRWHVIYEANLVELSSGRPLRPGMELAIPEN